MTSILSSSQNQAGVRLNSLDGLRAYSVSGVFLMHAGWGQGAFGVQIFFVLSGFLITRLLIEEYARTGTISTMQFYIRRGIRLLPALLFLFACVAVYSVTIAPSPFGLASMWGILYGLLYISNWAAAFPNFFPWGWLGVLGHTWTLAVEAQFYLVWPVVFLVIAGGTAMRNWFMLFVLAIIAEIYRVTLFHWGVSLSYFVNATDMNISGLLFGSAAAFIAPYFKRIPFHSIIPIAFLAYFAGFSARLYDLGPLNVDFGAGSFEIGAALAILSLLEPGRLSKAVFGNPLVVYVGRISYSLYLWHLPIIIALEQDGHFKNYPILLDVCKLAIPVAMAAFSYHAIERPALRRWKRSPTLTQKYDTGCPVSPAAAETSRG